jgi:hypothetical protein
VLHLDQHVIVQLREREHYLVGDFRWSVGALVPWAARVENDKAKGVVIVRGELDGALDTLDYPRTGGGLGGPLV